MELYKKQRQYFLDPNAAMIDGLIAVDDHVDVDRLLEAYSFGIFPWPQEGVPTLWFSPPERGILELDKYSPSKSLKKTVRQKPFEIRFNHDFEQVISECQKAYRPEQDGTWITDKLRNAYIDFHNAGYAHSVEAWQNGELVGGMYGVYVAGVFCGESMFYKVSNASKVCLHELIEALKRQGKTWMDIQMVTPYLESLGATYISRKVFLKKLEGEKAQAKSLEVPAFE